MLAKIALRARVAPRFARRSLATATTQAASDGPHVYKKATKVKLSFSTPYDIISNEEVDSVVIPGAAGVFTALPNTAATISELAPGLVRIKSGTNEKKIFVSGGFAVVNKDASVSISAAEALPLEDIDVEAVRG
jgi:F0F1-type ATP synthase epsilon subunit